MAYTSCIGAVTANIQENCQYVKTGGFTGRAVYIPMSAISAISYDDSLHLVEEITLKQNAKVVAIDNTLIAQPFNGSNKQGVADSGRPIIRKQFAVRLPYGASGSMQVLTPLMNDPIGGILIAEKKDMHDKYEVIGYPNGAHVDPTTVSQNDYENGGDFSFTFVSDEYAAHVSFINGTYEENLTAFEALRAKSF